MLTKYNEGRMCHRKANIIKIHDPLVIVCYKRLQNFDFIIRIKNIASRLLLEKRVLDL